MKITSAIPGMSVSEVRKLMNETRSKVDNMNERDALILSDKLSNNMVVSDFVFQVSHGLHLKRTKKRVDKEENESSLKKK